jgi:hypothetical protein
MQNSGGFLSSDYNRFHPWPGAGEKSVLSLHNCRSIK